MLSRPSRDETFMEIAEVWATRSTCTSLMSVGAVMVNPFGQIIASGYNGAPKGLAHCDDVGECLIEGTNIPRHIHAEENALLQCATNGVSSRGTTLYVTHSPCLRCTLRLIQAGVVCIVFKYETTQLKVALDLLAQAGIYSYKV